MLIKVVYSSAHGSTREIAERIADRLRAEGHTVTTTPLDAEVDIHDCDLLVIGSAVHNQQWLPEAENAVTALGEQLRGKSVWAFSVSSVGETSSFLSDRVARYLRPKRPEPRAVSELREIVDVRGHRFFAGAISPGDWPGIGRVVFRLMGGRYEDARDWDDIDSWAMGID